MALLVLFNNYLHDFAAAAFLVTALYVFWLSSEVQPGEESQWALFDRVLTRARWISLGSGGLIVVGGAVRTWAFRTYELIPAATKGLQTMLLVKHILLFGTVGVAVYLQFVVARRMRRRFRPSGDDGQRESV